MANYSGYNQQQYNNQKSYLDNLSKTGTAGQKAWAQSEMSKLNSQYGGNKNSGNSGTTQKTTSSGNTGSKNTASSSNKNAGNSGTNYSGYTQDQYDNQKTYLESLIKQGGGNANWAQNELNNLNSQYGGNNNSGNNGYWHENPDGSGTQYNNVDTGTWDTSGQKWTNVGGNDGVNYAISNDNGTIIATDSNGVQTRFLPTSEDYNSFYQNMLADIKNAGNNYTPTNSWTTANGTEVTTKDYLEGNSDLKYALDQSNKVTGSDTYDIVGYVLSLYNRIGTKRADGSVVTQADVDKELGRLGLSDYNSQNAILTAGQTLLPGNQFVRVHGDNGQSSNSPDSTWAAYGGQDYLIGGDSANFVDYVNGKTGNLNENLSYIFDDMANNPYAKEDTEFMNQYQQGQEQFNSIGNTGNTGSITGSANVDNFINYVNSVNNYNQATGNSSGDIWSEIQAMLQGGLDSQKEFLAQKRTQAEQEAEELARQAYVNNKMQGDSIKEALSAAGLGTSGAMQSAQLGVQSNYNNSLGDIRSNLRTMLSSFDEQELQALTDYMNKSTDFYYQIQNDQQDRAYQNAQLYLRQLEMQQNQQQQDWENAYKQQLLELDRQKYADSQAKERDETDYGKKLDSADYYSQIYNADKMSTAEYQRLLRELGIFA